jgi:hypothetical protein
MAIPPLVVDPPEARPTPPGLFNVADGPVDFPTEHMSYAGAVWLPDTCATAGLYPAPCQTPPYGSFTLSNVENLAQAWPFWAMASLVTGPLGISDDEAVRRVRQRLLLQEQYAVERAFWGGTATLFTGVTTVAGTAPPAAGSAGVAGGILEQIAAAGTNAGYVDLTGTTATNVADAVSVLEQAAADNYYGQAIIHARPAVAAYAAKNGQYRVIGLPPGPDKTYMYTQNLNYWNFGNGYAGTGPTGQAVVSTLGGTEYMWATGRVRIWRDPQIFVSPPDQLLNRTTNQRGVYAWRPYVVGLECFAACVKITRA